MAGLWLHANLLVDIWSVKLLVWLLGTGGELLDSHLFLYDRYSQLAEFHQRRGRTEKGERCSALAEFHYAAAPDDDDEPAAAAMAMPKPRPPLKTNAVGTRWLPPGRLDQESGATEASPASP
jgi:hypothetical protein